jgi:hypothetical protein
MIGGERGTERRGILIGGSGLFLAICCIAAPAILGVAIGATIGHAFDIGAAVLAVSGIAIVVHRRRAARGEGC